MLDRLALHNRLITALESAGITEPTPVQQQVIPCALEGADIQVSAETGSGKTLAYLLPLMHKMAEQVSNRSGSRALILLPTRELASQTFKECERLAKYIKARAVLVIGGQESRYQAALLRKDPDVIIATPGRLIEHLDRGSAILDDIEILVIDEADRMLDMGFRDEVLNIVGRCNKQRQSILLSATLSHRGVTYVAKEVLNEPEIFNIANAQTKHKHITQKMLLSDNSEHKQKQLLWILNETEFDKAVVFANKRVHVTELCEWLRCKDIDASELHGEIPQDERKHIVSMFKQGRFNVLVATDVAARGLDIEGVELVVNFDMAHSGDEYVHRIGRTGRAGNKGTAISLVADYEWNLTAGIQRYLKQSFEPIKVPGLEGKYKGPKKLKSSGKAAGKKSKKKEKLKPSAKKKLKAAEQKRAAKETRENSTEKKRHRDTKNIGKRRAASGASKSGWEAMTATTSQDISTGLAPPKKRPDKNQ